MKNIIIIILLITIQQAKSQEKSINSFRIKTEIVQFIGLNPNIFFEYKFNEKYACNSGITFHTNGIIWTAPYKLFSMHRNVEWWVVNGYGFDIGVKYFLSENKYLSLRTSIDKYFFNGTFSANSERDDAQITEKLDRLDFHIQILYGKENKPKNISFSEIYFGIGLLYVNEERFISEENYDSANNHFLGYKYVDYSTYFFVPTFLFGYNIGWKSDK